MYRAVWCAGHMRRRIHLLGLSRRAALPHGGRRRRRLLQGVKTCQAPESAEQTVAAPCLAHAACGGGARLRGLPPPCSRSSFLRKHVAADVADACALTRHASVLLYLVITHRPTMLQHTVIPEYARGGSLAEAWATKPASAFRLLCPAGGCAQPDAFESCTFGRVRS
jgi:hypothetical protein